MFLETAPLLETAKIASSAADAASRVHVVDMSFCSMLMIWFRLRRGPRMTFRERLTLSPLQKFLLFGRFPVKLMLHILITILVIIQINLLTGQFTPYARSSHKVFEHVFVPRKDMTTIKETVDAINSTVQNYYEFPEVSVNRWLLVNGSAALDSSPSVVLYVDRYVRNPYDGQRFNFSSIPQVREKFELTRTRLPPFDELILAGPEALRDFIYKVIALEMEFWYINVESGLLGAVPVLWRIALLFNFADDGGVVDVKLRALPSVVPADSPLKRAVDEQYSNLQPSVWISGMLAGLAALSLILSLKELLVRYRLYRKCKRLMDEKKCTMEEGGSLVDRSGTLEEIVEEGDLFDVNEGVEQQDQPRRRTPAQRAGAADENFFSINREFDDDKTDEIFSAEMTSPTSSSSAAFARQPVTSASRTSSTAPPPPPPPRNSFNRAASVSSLPEFGPGHHAARRRAMSSVHSAAGSAKRGSKPRFSTWSDVPLDIKLQFLSSWAILNTIGSLSLIISSSYGVGTSLGLALSDMHNIFLGLGACIFSVSFLRYAEFSDKMYMLSLTVKLASVHVMRMLLSVMPAFVGFLLFGHVVFSRYSERFKTLDETAVSLFALLNGDDLHATFNDLASDFPFIWISRIYLYLFVFFFISTILNIFIIIIEDAFVASKTIVFGNDEYFAERPFDVRRLFDAIEMRQQEDEKKEKVKRVQQEVRRRRQSIN